MLKRIKHEKKVLILKAKLVASEIEERTRREPDTLFRLVKCEIIINKSASFPVNVWTRECSFIEGAEEQ